MTSEKFTRGKHPIVNTHATNYSNPNDTARVIKFTFHQSMTATCMVTSNFHINCHIIWDTHFVSQFCKSHMTLIFIANSLLGPSWLVDKHAIQAQCSFKHLTGAVTNTINLNLRLLQGQERINI